MPGTPIKIGYSLSLTGHLAARLTGTKSGHRCDRKPRRTGQMRRNP
jgi:hypothetical protein